MNRLILSIVFACCLCSCSRASLYSGGGADLGSVVEFSQWPPLAKGVAGYNIYMSEEPKGKFVQVNGSPISSGKIVIPKLEKGKDYYFQMTAVTAAGLEGKPSRVIVRKAFELKPGQTKPAR